MFTTNSNTYKLFNDDNLDFMKRLPEVDDLVVQALVALGREVPAEIAFHVVLDEVVPVLFVVVAILCTAAGIVQLMGAVTGKGKAVALAQRAVMDGIPQAAGLTDDGRLSLIHI